MMRVVLTLGFATMLAASCGGDNDAGADDDGRPSVVVTSTILGDIVGEVAGDAATVEVLFPLGVDPHEFSPSVRQAEAMGDADLLVISGAGFEGGLDDAIESAADAGAEVFAFADHVELLGDDPHYWTDPTLVATGLAALADALVDAGADAGVEDRATAYAAELEAVDAEIEALLADIPADRRVLVTNHEVLAYFADRYGFEVIGAVIPSLTTGAEPSAADVDELAALIEAEGVPAIFGETSSPSALARALADAAAGDVVVVELFTESLGDAGSGAETYLDLLRTDASLIRDALA
jgi:zinc/manganese transport system substrate-binding protein